MFRLKKFHFVVKVFIMLLWVMKLPAYGSQTNPVERESWMTALADPLKKIPIKNLIIPGTHDSMTHRINWRSSFAKEQDVPQQLNWLKYVGVGFAVTKIAADWSKAQEKSAREQLIDGIRYFDFRVVWRDSKKEFYTVHGLYGESLTPILEEINKFLEQHPKELVILDFNHLYNITPELHQNLLDEIRSIFDHKIASAVEEAPLMEFTPDTLLEEFQNNQKQVIVFCANSEKLTQVDDPHSDKNAWVWPSAHIRSPWPNKAAIPDLKTSLEGSMTSSNYQNCFFVLQCLLTPTDDTIFQGLSPFSKRPSGLKDLSLAPKKLLQDTLEDWAKNPSLRINIIITDFLDEEALLNRIIQSNLTRHKFKEP